MEYAILAGFFTACTFAGSAISNWLFKPSDNSEKINNIVKTDIKIKDTVEMNSKFEVILIILIAVGVLVAIAFAAAMIKNKCKSESPKDSEMQLQVIDKLAPSSSDQ